MLTPLYRKAAVYLSLCCRTLEGIRERKARDTNPAEVKMNGVANGKGRRRAPGQHLLARRQLFALDLPSAPRRIEQLELESPTELLAASRHGLQPEFPLPTGSHERQLVSPQVA